MAQGGSISLSSSTVVTGTPITITVALTGGSGRTVTGVNRTMVPGTSGLLEQATKLIGMTDTGTASFEAVFFNGSPNSETLTIGLSVVLSDGTVFSPSTADLTITPPAIPGGVFPNETT